MALDACGNLYVVVMDGRVYRVAPTGAAVEIADLGADGPVVTTALHFGSGVGGWESDHLYVMDRANAALFAIPVGVSGSP